MRVLAVDPKPFHWLAYINAAKGGGSERARLPFVRARVDRLPEGCSCVVLASDLQGRMPPPDHELLLGEGVARELEALSDARTIPNVRASIAILAGDLYGVPGAAKRGGFGPVDAVYDAFGERFDRVFGVAGNHDDVSRGVRPPCELLDGDVVDVGGVRLGGVGLVAGSRGKPGKRSEEDQLALIDLVLAQSCDVLVLHEGPSTLSGDAGSDAIRRRITAAKLPLTVSGHRAWREPLVDFGDGVGVLNVHERVVIATA